MDQDNVDCAAGAVRGRAVGRCDEPRVLAPGLLWAEVGAAGLQLVEAEAP
jgi:hypothetical protein